MYFSKFIVTVVALGLISPVFARDDRHKFCPYGYHIHKECADSKGAKNCPCEKDAHQNNKH